ncbi:fumarylacetoacetate hydrolase family protein [Pusillimonas noertemannii]|uniref:fumarylacetoacetate hydrolase family protein n=1 Tax=Pusillimonas noertemannii TaxID=305977 RepID=UPI00333EAC6B
MKICRYNDNRLGIIEGSDIVDVTPALELLPRHQYPLPVFDPLVADLGRVCRYIDEIKSRGARMPLEKAKLLSPVANPGKIIAAPVNYQKHLEEVLGDPNLHNDVRINHIQRAGLFLKAASSLVGAGEGVTLRMPERRNDHEVELAVVLGKTASRVHRSRALEYVAGYCVALDITIRGPEERSFRKSPDSYTVLGPWLTTADEVNDPDGLELQLYVNGQARQRANTRDLILDVPALIEFASSFYTLLPGDVIITGTPEGVGPIQAGDVLHASVQHLGAIEVKVDAPDSPTSSALPYP